MNSYPNNNGRNRPAPSVADGRPAARPNGRPTARPDGRPAARSDGRPAVRSDGRPVARSDGRPATRPGDPRTQIGERSSRPVTLHTGQNASPHRASVSKPKKTGGMAKAVAIWAALLAILLIVIFVIAFSGRDPVPASESVGAGVKEATVEQSTAIVTETDVSVEFADMSDNLVAFDTDREFSNGILIDLETNSVISTRGGDARIYPASMTKIMTMIVAVEETEDFDETFTMVAEITDPLYLANASVAGFAIGEEVTVRDLIYGLMLPSGGDGALGLAYHIAGSEAAFAELMNEKAEEMGLKDTHFTNCTGLHGDDHYSTCHEIALMLKYAIENEFMREVLCTYEYTTEKTPEHPEGIKLTSTMLSRMNGDESGAMFVQGGKTGFTTEAKNCLASFATDYVSGITEEELKVQETRYILVTAGSPDKYDPVYAAIDIYGSLGEAPEETETAAVSVEAPQEEPDSATGKDDASIIIYTVRDPE